MQRIYAVVLDHLRRENAQILHCLQELRNRLAVFTPEFGKLGVVGHELTGQEFDLFGLGDLYKSPNMYNEIKKGHEALHAVNLILLVSKILHLIFRQGKRVVKHLLFHNL